MPYYCTVPRCTSMAGKAKNVSFHQFPRDEELARLWNNILKRGKPYTKYSKVCSLHFRPEDYTITSVGKNKGQWRTLRKGAIPSRNLPSDSPTPIHQRTRGPKTWTPNALPPNMQQQMAQAIYIQTMLAMQAANGSQPIPMHNFDSTKCPMTTSSAQSSNFNLSEIEQLLSQNKHVDSDQESDNLERIPSTENIQENIEQETHNINHNLQEISKITSFKCEECSKCFKDPDVFVLHRRTHATEMQKLPVNLMGQEKENFNSNTKYSSEETLRANPILANLLKSGISNRVPEVPNGILDTNNILSIENQIMAALAANMESYIRNLSTMLRENPTESENGENSENLAQGDNLDENSLQNGDNSDQESQNSVEGSQDCAEDDQDDSNFAQDSPHENQNSPQGQYDQNLQMRGQNSEQFIENSPQDGQDSTNDLNLVQSYPFSSHCSDNTAQLCQNSAPFGQNSAQYGQNSAQYGQNSAQYGQDLVQECQNSLEFPGQSVKGPNCDSEDLNESKDSNNLVIDEDL